MASIHLSTCCPDQVDPSPTCKHMRADEESGYLTLYVDAGFLDGLHCHCPFEFFFL